MPGYFLSPEELEEQKREAEATATPAAAASEQSDLNSVLKALSARVMAGDKSTPEEQQLQQLWNKAESQNLQKLTGDQSTENWAVGLGTAIPMLAGIFADATTKNAYGVRGTSLGKIAEAGVQNAQQLLQQQAQRREQQQSLAQAAAGVRKQNQDRDFERLSKLASTLQEADRIKNQSRSIDRLYGKDIRDTQRHEQDALKFDYLTNPQNEQAQAVIERMIANGASPNIRGLSVSAIRDADPALRAEIDKHAAWSPGGKIDQAVTQTSRSAAAGENARSRTQFANRDQDAETQRVTSYGSRTGAGQAEIDQAPVINEATGKTAQLQSAAAQSFYKDAEPTLKATKEIDDVLASKDASGSIPGLSRAERFVTAAGGGSMLGAQAQRTQQRLELAREYYKRDQSGAAIAAAEDANFALQMLGDPKASDADVERALREFNEASKRAIRARAAANPEAAQSVIDGMEIDMDVRPKRQPAARTNGASKWSGNKQTPAAADGVKSKWSQNKL